MAGSTISQLYAKMGMPDLEALDLRRPAAKVDWSSPPTEVRPWLAENAVPLALDIDAPIDDLARLDAAVGKARIIGLGEATHGTSEFVRIRHRLVRWLVEKHGVTTIAFEGFPGHCEVVDQLLNDPAGDLTDAARMIYGGSSPWDTVEILEFLRWLRRHNADLPEELRVRFHGFDVHGTAGAPALVSLLEQIDVDLAGQAREALVHLANDHRRGQIRSLSEPDRSDIVARIDGLLDSLRDRREHLIELTSLDTYQRIERHAMALSTIAVTPTPTDFVARMRWRDIGMAQILLGILQQQPPGGRVVAWAHNGHLQRGDYWVDVPAAGQHLADALGDGYLPISTAFGGGRFRAHRLGEYAPREVFAVPPAPAGSFDGTLSEHSAECFAIDLRTAGGAVGDWLASPVPTRTIGGGYLNDEEMPVWLDQSPAAAQDIVVFVRETNGVELLPSENAPVPAEPKEPSDDATNLDLSDRDEVGRPVDWTVRLGSRLLRYELSDARDLPLSLERSPSPWAGGAAQLGRRIKADSWRDATVSVTLAATHRPIAFGDEAMVSVQALDADGAPLESSDATVDNPFTTVEIDVPENAQVLALSIVLLGQGPLTIRGVMLEKSGA